MDFLVLIFVSLFNDMSAKKVHYYRMTLRMKLYSTAQVLTKQCLLRTFADSNHFFISRDYKKPLTPEPRKIHRHTHLKNSGSQRRTHRVCRVCRARRVRHVARRQKYKGLRVRGIFRTCSSV